MEKKITLMKFVTLLFVYLISINTYSQTYYYGYSLTLSSDINVNTSAFKAGSGKLPSSLLIDCGGNYGYATIITGDSVRVYAQGFLIGIKKFTNVLINSKIYNVYMSTGSFNGYYNFNIESSSIIPSLPITPTPLNNSNSISCGTSKLTWNWEDLRGADSAFIYLGTSSNPTIIDTIRTELNPYYLVKTNPNTKYYWKIVPFNKTGLANNPIIWTFTTNNTITYKVTFNSQGGNYVMPTLANLNSLITYPNQPTKAGYIFAGWFKEPTCTNQWNFNADYIINDIELYAKWVIGYSVFFNTQGGNNISSQTLPENSLIQKPSDPSKVGYTFMGWYKEPTCTNQWNFATDILTTNLSLYAKWDIQNYSVTFNSQGGSSINTTSYPYNSMISKPNNPTKVGYLFSGWFKEQSFQTEWNFSTDKIVGNTILYAKWIANKYMVKFDSRNGSYIAPINVPYNSPFLMPTNPTKPGYSFLAWYTDSTYNSIWDFASSKVTSDTILYAKWKIKRLTVGNTGQDYSTITAAFQNATVDDTILVYEGIYYENLTVNKQIFIKSVSGPFKTVIRPLQNGEPIISFITGCGKSLIKGFSLTNGGQVRGSAINLYVNRSITNIQNCIISNNSGDGAVEIYYSAGLFENCVFINNKYSNIFSDPSSEGVFINCNIYKSYYFFTPQSNSHPFLFLNCNFDFIPTGNIEVNYSNVLGGYLSNNGTELGINNLNCNPEIDSTYQLKNYSKLIGKGIDKFKFNRNSGIAKGQLVNDTITLFMPKFDLYNNIRSNPNGSNPDIGVFENTLVIPDAVPTLTISANSLLIAATANSVKSFDITSNVSWTVSSNQPWLTIDKTSGSGNSTLTVTAQANPLSNIRNATITISGLGVANLDITVTQDAGTTDITEIANNEIFIFPNPTSSTLFINGLTKISTVSIVDLRGMPVLTQKYISNQIDISKLKNGIYIIKIENQTGITLRRFIKQ